MARRGTKRRRAKSRSRKRSGSMNTTSGYRGKLLNIEDGGLKRTKQDSTVTKMKASLLEIAAEAGMSGAATKTMAALFLKYLPASEVRNPTGDNLGAKLASAFKKTFGIRITEYQTQNPDPSPSDLIRLAKDGRKKVNATFNYT